MLLPLATQLSGPIIRLLVIAVAAYVVFVFADFGGLVDSLWFDIEQLIESLISPF